MADSYIGEIRMFGGNFAPTGWMLCSGQSLAISDYDTLFNLIGTTYGGDGQSTFNLPDLRGRLPVHQGNLFVVGAAAGDEQATVSLQQMPSHSHTFFASGDGANTPQPENAFLATSTSISMFIASDPLGAPMNPKSLTPAGGNQPHSNMQPSLCVNFIISLYGIYPSPQ